MTLTNSKLWEMSPLYLDLSVRLEAGGGRAPLVRHPGEAGYVERGPRLGHKVGCAAAGQTAELYALLRLHGQDEALGRGGDGPLRAAGRGRGREIGRVGGRRLRRRRWAHAPLGGGGEFECAGMGFAPVFVV